MNNFVTTGETSEALGKWLSEACRNDETESKCFERLVRERSLL